MNLVIIMAAAVVIAVIVAVFSRKSGYRGAVGFKNRHAAEIATIRLTGFSTPVDCRTLAPGEHSFNYLSRQNIPAEVQIAWRFVGDTADKTAQILLSDVPKDAADGELFFVLSSNGRWTVEYAPQLQVDKLQRNE